VLSDCYISLCNLTNILLTHCLDPVYAKVSGIEMANNKKLFGHLKFSSKLYEAIMSEHSNKGKID
jgi:hypothetical protein